MKIDFNRVDDLNAKMTVVIERPDYASKLDENLKNHSKKVNIKGFRPGKTPKSVLTKMYGKGMLEETVTSLLNERLFKYLEEENIDIFGSPMIAREAEPVDFNPKAPGDYTFIFDIGLKPTFELNYSFDEPLEIITVETDQATLDDDMLRYRRTFGNEELIHDGTVEAHDRVGVKLRRISENGTVENDAIDTLVDLDRVKGTAPSILPGLGVGSTLEADVEEFFGSGREDLIKDTLNLQEDPSPGSPLKYHIEITNISRPQTTELTGEQISKFVGREIEDEAVFRNILESRTRNTNLARINDLKKMTVRRALLKANHFDIPEKFLLNWVNSQREKQIVPGSREANNLFREARWSLLLNRISTEAGLEVTEKDIQKQVTNWVVENVNYTQTDIRKLMKELYSNEYFMSTMKENALEEVVFSHIIPGVDFVEKEGSPVEFEHAFHDLHHELFDHGDHIHG